jgi:hypothetical protein
LRTIKTAIFYGIIVFTVFLSIVYYVDTSYLLSNHDDRDIPYEFNELIDSYLNENIYSLASDGSVFVKNLSENDANTLINIWNNQYVHGTDDPKNTVGYAISLYLGGKKNESETVLSRYINKIGYDGYVYPLYISLLISLGKEPRIININNDRSNRTIYSNLINGYVAAKNGKAGVFFNDIAHVLIKDPYVILLFSGQLLKLFLPLTIVLLLIFINRKYKVLEKIRMIDSFDARTYFYILIFTVLGLYLFMTEYMFLANQMGLRFPHNTYLTPPQYRYQDHLFVCNYGKLLLHNINPYISANNSDPSSFTATNKLNYFSGSLFIARILAFFPKHIALSMTIISFFLFLCLVVRAVWEVTDHNALITGLASMLFFFGYPIRFAIEIGNIEIFSFIFIMLFFYFLIKRNELLSIIFLSLSMSIKPFPAVFLLLIWRRFGLKSAIKTCVLSAALILLILYFLPGNFLGSLFGMLHNTKQFGDLCGPIMLHSRFNHSLARLISRFYPLISFHLPFYSFIATALFLLIYLLNIINKSLLNQSIYLGASMIFLPYVSNDYTLLHLYPMLLLLIVIAHMKSKNNESISPPYMYISLLIVIILSPKSLFIGSVLNSLLLLFLIVLSMYYDLDNGNKYFNLTTKQLITNDMKP